MTVPPTITNVECIEFEYPIENMEDPSKTDAPYPGYAPGETYKRAVMAIRIKTDTDFEGSYVCPNSPPGPTLAQIDTIAPYLIGKNPFEREKHWNHFKLTLRKFDKMGIGPIDIALWDFAGKFYDAPIHQMLGTYRTSIKTYASTAFGDDNGGLDSPESYADFAEECQKQGFPAFKIHGWRPEASHLDVEREIETIRAVGQRVGDDMDLMYDPVGQLETFGDALKVGKECDRQDFFWIEDAYRDCGTSQFGNRKLGNLITTPTLQTEQVRGLEAHTDFVANEGTDFVRADPDYDGGITGAMKIAKMAEGFGLDVEVHTCGPAHRHCIAGVRNTNYYELGLLHPDHQATNHPPVYTNGYSDLISGINNEGEVPIPTDPGLGVTYDWDFIYDNSVSTETYN